MRAIVFDLDDTLYPEYEFVLSGFKSINIPGFYEVAKLKFESGLRNTIFNETLNELGVRYDEDDIKTLVETYRSHKPNIEMFSDAKWALSYFKDCKIGIITDGYARTQRNKVKALQINLEHIIYTDDYGRDNWKPSLLPYELIAETLNANPKECVYVGDNVSKDFISANKLGWTTIQIVRPYGEFVTVKKDDEYQAQISINSLYALKSLFPTGRG